MIREFSKIAVSHSMRVWFVSFLTSDQISELCQTIKHSSLELHPEVEGFFFLGCRHRRSRLRPAISPAALREKSLFFHLKMSSSKCLFFHLRSLSGSGQQPTKKKQAQHTPDNGKLWMSGNRLINYLLLASIIHAPVSMGCERFTQFKTITSQEFYLKSQWK